MNKEKIYNKAPLLIKRLLLNIVGYKNSKSRYNKQFEYYLNEYKNTWLLSKEEISNYQTEKLSNLLIEALEHSKWYKKEMLALGITKSEISQNPIKTLKKLSILSKTQRKTKVESIINKNPNRPITEIGYTSGTSGSPTKNYVDLESINRSFALWKRFHWTIGINEYDKHIRFSGRIIIDSKRQKPPFWIYNFFEKQLLMSTYHLTEQNIGKYVNKINKFKPTYLDGYPSAIYIIARYVNKNKIQLKNYPKAIAVTAETLYDYQRVEIEKAFKCKVYNQYASSEGSPFITQCKEGNLHINEDSGYFEFLDQNNNEVKKGEIAQLVVTSFRNFKTPLIRYNIEDTVLTSNSNIKCKCGCNMLIVEKIIGREDDILWTREKGYVGRMDTAYKGLTGIVKSQIIQNDPNTIIINNIIDDEYNKQIEQKFLKNLKERLGENINYTINIVDNIPLGPNGKFDAVKRNFKIKL